jgi:hypothetical protein
LNFSFAVALTMNAWARLPSFGRRLAVASRLSQAVDAGAAFTAALFDMAEPAIVDAGKAFGSNVAENFDFALSEPRARVGIAHALATLSPVMTERAQPRTPRLQPGQ